MSDKAKPNPNPLTYDRRCLGCNATAKAGKSMMHASGCPQTRLVYS